MEHLTEELHGYYDRFRGMNFVETPDALLSQFLARKPVCRFVIPHMTDVLRRTMFSTMCKTGTTATITPQSLIHKGAKIKFTEVEIHCW